MHTQEIQSGITLTNSLELHRWLSLYIQLYNIMLCPCIHSQASHYVILLLYITMCPSATMNQQLASKKKWDTKEGKGIIIHTVVCQKTPTVSS